MFSYTTSALYSAGTSYKKTESNSGNTNSQTTNSDEAFTGLADATFTYANGNAQNSGNAEYFIGPDGGRSGSASGSGGETFGYVSKGYSGSNSGSTAPDGAYTNQNGYTRTYSATGEIVFGDGRVEIYTESEKIEDFRGETRNLSGVTRNAGSTRTRDNAYEGQEVFSGTGSQTETFNTTTRAIQTSTTTTYEYLPATTKQTTLYNKKGITTTVGTITFPTTTETSWTEITITNSTKTKKSTVVTTTSESSHNSAITAHTIIHVGDGETLYTLIQSPNIGTPFTGTENWQSIQGPDTITISRWPCATYQCEVLDASVDPYDSNATDTSSTKTVTVMNGVETANVTQFYKTTEGLPLGSSSLEGAGSKIETTSITYVDVSSPPLTFATSERVAVTQTATHNVSIGGVAFPVNGKAETTNVTVVVPVVRSAKTNTEGNEGGVSFNDENGFGEEGNFFVSYGVHNIPNAGGIFDAYLRRAYAWATVGDGTSATAEPKQSWNIDGVSKVTWAAVSVSDGVATPWPAFGVETTSTTTSTAENQTASTASTATATTAIWGNVYRKKTSSSNSSGVTSSVKTTQLNAAGNGHTMLELGGLPALPTPAYIPSPVGSVLPVFGAAHIDDKRTVIILPAEYANSTVTAPETFSGSTLTETYFETKSLQIVLEGQGGAAQRLESL